MKVGVVGLGRMGGAMSVRLLDAGHEVSVYDPAEALVQELVQKGARGCASLAEVCKGVEAVMTVLPTDAIFEQVTAGAGGLVEHMEPGAIHMVAGTQSPLLVERLAEAHAAKGQILLTTNLLGRPERAVSGELGFIIGGPRASADKVQPLLDAMGSSFVYAGETPASAVICKLANSFVLGCAIEAMGEGMSLVRKYGVDPHVLHQVLTEGLFGCPAYKAYGDLIAKEDWERVGATILIGLKDTNLAFEAAHARQVPLPAGEVYRNHLLAAQNKGESLLDWSVMAREQFRQSGLE